MTLILHLHLSNISRSPISLGNNIASLLESNSSELIEFLLQALEINRSLMATMNKDWGTEEELYEAVQILTNQQKELEYKVAQKLSP